MLSWDLGFQDPATGLAEALINLYNVVGFFLVLIFIMVSYLFLVILVKSLYKGAFNNDILTVKGFFEQNLINTLNFTYLANMYKGDKKYDFLKIYDISEYHILEKVWTIFPAGILISIIVPSFSVEYWLDPKVSPYMVVKVIGNQWYWSYECNVNLSKLGIDNVTEWFEYSEIYHSLVKAQLNDVTDPEFFKDTLNNLDPVTIVSYDFDMNLIEGIGDGVNPQRLLQVDNRLVLPVGVPIRILITASDVLHSWAVPSLGVKVDAVPGRLSSFVVFIDRPGLFFGQCSEICGPMHGFMPIVIEAVSVNNFITYVLSDLDSYRDLIEGKFQGDIPVISDNRIFEILEARDFGASEGHNCV